MSDESKKYSDPIEFVIDFAWSCGCDKFTINNAKDELKKLKKIMNEFEQNKNESSM